MYRRNIWSINLTLVLCFCFSQFAYSLETDFGKNIIIDANQQKLDLKNNTLTFLGKVEISQGSLKMTADKLEVIKNESENNQQELLIATGQPTLYTQTLESGEVLTAQALEIRYLVAEKLLTLKGEAKITQKDSLVNGDKIEYDLTKQKLVASSNKQSGNKVRTVLTPKSEQ